MRLNKEKLIEECNINKDESITKINVECAVTDAIQKSQIN